MEHKKSCQHNLLDAFIFKKYKQKMKTDRHGNKTEYYHPLQQDASSGTEVSVK
jgi:hypothetical protein